MEWAARWILSFTIYSFLGWVCETAYCSAGAGKIVNRGFLSGPFCPVYGFGAMLVIHLLSPVGDHPLVIFLLGAVLTSLLEYLTSYLLEKLFHMKWWDYSDRFLNIRGRVCLLNSTLFGLLSVIVMEGIHPLTMRVVGWFVPPWLYLAVGVLLGYFLWDTVVTTREVLAMSGKLAELHALMEEVAQRQKAYRESLQQNLEIQRAQLQQNLETHKMQLQQSLETQRAQLAEAESRRRETARLRLEQLTEQLSQRLQGGRGTRRLLAAFPGMKSLRHPEALERMRHAVREYYEKKHAAKR